MPPSMSVLTEDISPAVPKLRLLSEEEYAPMRAALTGQEAARLKVVGYHAMCVAICAQIELAFGGQVDRLDALENIARAVERVDRPAFEEALRTLGNR